MLIQKRQPRNALFNAGLLLSPLVLFLFVVAAVLPGCGSGGNGGSGASAGSGGNPITTPTKITAPTPMNLYPVDGTSNNSARLFIFVTAVGSQAVQSPLPLAFDTGSAGVTLNALAIFPSSMVNAQGFIFSGASSLTYNGITITNLQGTRSYGGAAGRTELGNLGFATVTFGDSTRSVTTQSMPVFLYYAIQSNANPPQTLSAQTQDGWFGVNDAPNLIKLGGSESNAPECTDHVMGSCWVASVFKYLQYGPGVDAGFTLSPLTVQNCDITSAGSCTPVAALTIGLGPSSSEGFSLSSLPCPPLGYTGPSMIQGYSVCQEYVPGTPISIIGTSNETFTASVIFDTGTPDFILNIPTGTAVPSTVASFQVTTPSGFVYSATTGSDLYGVHVQQASAATSGSVVGLAYFETNSLLTDFATGMQGWK